MAAMTAGTKTKTCPCTVVCKKHKNAQAAWDCVDALLDTVARWAGAGRGGQQVVIFADSPLVAQFREAQKARE